MPTVRRLTAILAADVAGYSRLTGADEEGTHGRLKAHLRELVDPKVAEHYGRIVKNTGDGFLAEFASVVHAVRCAVEVQRRTAKREANVPEERLIRFRIGINLGDVIADANDIFGDGVNVAARLEALAEPGGIASLGWSESRCETSCRILSRIGEQPVKNITRPVRVFALRPETIAELPIADAPIPVPRRRHSIVPQVAVAAAAVLVAMGIAWWVWSAARSTSTPAIAGATAVTTPIAQPLVAPRLSIVVLPFVNLSNDPDQEYFADGITDDLTTDLSRISGSFVIARNTAFTYKNKPVDAKQIGHELDVRYVLEGSVRRTGDQVRVNVQLIDTGSGAHIWADRFDTNRSNLPEAQNEITVRLAQSLNFELVRDASRWIEKERALNPDARDLIMRGWASIYQPRTVTNTQEAERAFEQALALDPRSVDARIGVALTLCLAVANGWSGSVQQDVARAEQLLLEALDRDQDQSKAHIVMAGLRQTQKRYSEARIEAEKAVELDPNFAFAHNALGQSLLYTGQPDAAIPHYETALRLSPLDPNIWSFYWGLRACHLVLGHVDAATDFFRKARAATRFWAMHLWMAAALGLKGDLDEAKAALAESLRLDPKVDTIAHWRAQFPALTNPPFRALLEKTWVIGLRRAGSPTNDRDPPSNRDPRCWRALKRSSSVQSRPMRWHATRAPPCSQCCPTRSPVKPQSGRACLATFPERNRRAWCPIRQRPDVEISFSSH